MKIDRNCVAPANSRCRASQAISLCHTPGSCRAPSGPSGGRGSGRAASAAGVRIPSTFVFAASLLLLTATGCPTGPNVGPIYQPSSIDADTALRRINDNLERLADKVECQAVVTVKFRDQGGQKRQFVGHEATLRFAAPRCLRFDVRGLTGVIAQFGSNDDYYWVWVEPELDTLWYGQWAYADTIVETGRMPIPPQRLLDGLMLNKLPMTLGGQRPELLPDGGGYRLVYYRPDGVALREFRLDQRSWLPYEVIERDAAGQIAMVARLSDYQRIGDRGPYVPRRYDVSWPASEGFMVLRVKRAKFRPDLPDWFCEFPAKWGGKTESLDG